MSTTNDTTTTLRTQLAELTRREEQLRSKGLTHKSRKIRDFSRMALAQIDREREQLLRDQPPTTSEQLDVKRSQLRRGDVVLSCTGAPLFEVDSVHDARARQSVVVFGKFLDGRGPYDGQTLAGHRDVELRVLRSK